MHNTLRPLVPTYMPCGCAHNWFQFKPFLLLCSSREVENPVVVDQSYQRPGLANKCKDDSDNGKHEE